jgi:hypothetical protein
VIEMANAATIYSADKKWKMEVDAWKHNWLVYKSIGAEATTYHWEEGHRTWFGRVGPGWRQRPVDGIAVECLFKGALVNRAPQGAQRSEVGKKVSHVECKLWAVGASISADMTGDSVSNPSVGGAAVLEVDAVKGSAIAQNWYDTTSRRSRSQLSAASAGLLAFRQVRTPISR